MYKKKTFHIAYFRRNSHISKKQMMSNGDISDEDEFHDADGIDII